MLVSKSTPIRYLALVLAGAALIYAQGNTGSILGTVTDSSGAVIPNAKMTITNKGTGVKAESTSDGAGNYLFNFLQPGIYRVDAEVSGFKRFQRDNVTLEMTKQLRIDVAMETGQLTESVSVTAQTPLLETETGSLSTTIENRQVVSLPTIG